MKRNGGIIGPNREPSPNSTVGIYDSFDQYNSTLYDLWTRSAGYNSITYDRGAQVFEGDTLVFNVSTIGVSNNTRVYWFIFNINGVTSSDFVGGETSGSFLINNNLGSFSITLTIDTISEPNRQFRVQLRTQNNVNAAVVLQTGVIQILEPAASVTGPSSINEGQTATFTITTVDFTSGTLNWSIEQMSGTKSVTDYASDTGSVVISGSTGTVSIEVLADTFTEGTESFRLILYGTTGTVIAASNTVTINDTSVGGSEGSANLAVRVLWIANDYVTAPTANLKTLNDNLANSQPQFYTNSSTFTNVTQAAGDLSAPVDHTPYDVCIWSNNYRGGSNVWQTLIGFLNNNKGVVWCNFAHTYWNAQQAYDNIGSQWQITAAGGWTPGDAYGQVSGVIGIMKGVTEQSAQGYLATGFTPVNGGAYADQTNTNSTYRLAIYKDFGQLSRRVDINAWIGGGWDDNPSVENNVLRCLLNSCYWSAKRWN